MPRSSLRQSRRLSRPGDESLLALPLPQVGSCTSRGEESKQWQKRDGQEEKEGIGTERGCANRLVGHEAKGESKSVGKLGSRWREQAALFAKGKSTCVGCDKRALDLVRLCFDSLQKRNGLAWSSRVGPELMF